MEPLVGHCDPLRPPGSCSPPVTSAPALGAARNCWSRRTVVHRPCKPRAATLTTPRGGGGNIGVAWGTGSWNHLDLPEEPSASWSTWRPLCRAPSRSCESLPCGEGSGGEARQGDGRRGAGIVGGSAACGAGGGEIGGFGGRGRRGGGDSGGDSGGGERVVISHRSAGDGDAEEESVRSSHTAVRGSLVSWLVQEIPLEPNPSDPSAPSTKQGSPHNSNLTTAPPIPDMHLLHLPLSRASSTSSSSSDDDDDYSGTPAVAERPASASGPRVGGKRAALGRLVNGVLGALVSPERLLHHRVRVLMRDPATRLGELACRFRARVGQEVAAVEATKAAATPSRASEDEQRGEERGDEGDGEVEVAEEEETSTTFLQELGAALADIREEMSASQELESGVLQLLPEESRESVLESCLAACLLRPLHGAIVACLEARRGLDGSASRLARGLRAARGGPCPCMWCGGERPLAPPSVEGVRRTLAAMGQAYAPHGKVARLLAACRLVYDAMGTATSRGEALGADDFVPALVHVVSRVELPSLIVHVLYAMEMMNPLALHGEGGYYLTTIYGVLFMLEREPSGGRCERRGLSRRAQRSLHSWERRRTARLARR